MKEFKLLDYDGDSQEWEREEKFSSLTEAEDYIYNVYPINTFSVEYVIVSDSDDDDADTYYSITNIIYMRYKTEALDEGESEDFAENVGVEAVEEFNWRKKRQSPRFASQPLPTYYEIAERLRD